MFNVVSSGQRRTDFPDRDFPRPLVHHLFASPDRRLFLAYMFSIILWSGLQCQIWWFKSFLVVSWNMLYLSDLLLMWSKRDGFLKNQKTHERPIEGVFLVSVKLGLVPYINTNRVFSPKILILPHFSCLTSKRNDIIGNKWKVRSILRLIRK